MRQLSSSDSYSSGPDFRKKYQQAVDEKLKLEQELAAHRKRERYGRSDWHLNES